MSNMTTFQLSQDQSVLSVGPSLRSVYIKARLLDQLVTAVAKSRLDGATSTDFFSQAVSQYRVVAYLPSVYPGFCSVEASASTGMREALHAMTLSVTR